MKLSGKLEMSWNGITGPTALLKNFGIVTPMMDLGIAWRQMSVDRCTTAWSPLVVTLLKFK